MAGPLGLDLDGLTGAIQSGLGDLLGRDFAGGDAFAGVSYGGNDPFKGVQYGADPFAGVQYAGSPQDWGTPGNNNPFEAQNPFEYTTRGLALAQGALDAKRAGDANAKPPGAGTTTNPSTSGTGTPGEGFGTPTVAQLEKELVGSPLDGYGGTIARLAAQHGVPVAVAMAILRQESSYGRAPAQGTRYNYGGLKGSGGSGAFADFASADQGLDAVIANLGSALYQGKGLYDFLNTYLGGPAGGDPQTYYANVIDTIHRLGGTADPNSVVINPRPAAAPAAPGGGTTTSRGFQSVWGGQGNPQVSQEFGKTDYSDGNPIYDYGKAFGVSGHTGVDVALAHGTKLYTPAGGTVLIAGGRGPGEDRPYYMDETGQYDPNHSGQIRIRLDNGWELILGHTSQVNVQVGQRLSAGDLVGLSGTANGAHVHVELRVPDSSTPSGYRIVDPRAYLR